MSNSEQLPGFLAAVEGMHGEYRMVPIDSIEANPWNVNRMTADEFGALKEGIQLLGHVQRARVRPWEPNNDFKQTWQLIDGQHNWQAAREIGFTEFPVEVLEIDDAMAKKAGLILNQHGHAEEVDTATLLAELEQSFGEDLRIALAYTEQQLSNLITSVTYPFRDPPKVSDSGLTAPEGDPISSVGEVYELGRHRLICGDATDPKVVAELLGEVRPFLMVTDPPYGVDYDPEWRNEAARKGLISYGATSVGQVKNDDRIDWRSAFELFPGDVVYCWHASLYGYEVKRAMDEAGFESRSQIIWIKDRFAISRGHYHYRHEACWYAVRAGRSAAWCGGRSQDTVWGISLSENHDATVHGTQKPVEAMARPMRNHGTRSDAVYDPFVGSGTSFVAAELTGRTCYAIELDPAYCDVSRRRFADFVGDRSLLP